MAGGFRVVSTPGFERDLRRVSRGNRVLLQAVRGLLAVLAEDPHNRGGSHQIKKLSGLKPGEGQWRIRWHQYCLRYDIIGAEVLLYSFRHRKDAY
jgi:mRNA-degrading endonuclease RelE of RelBE toxin-antitoxin system